jgi:ribosomal protein L4
LNARALQIPPVSDALNELVGRLSGVQDQRINRFFLSRFFEEGQLTLEKRNAGEMTGARRQPCLKKGSRRPQIYELGLNLLDLNRMCVRTAAR